MTKDNKDKQTLDFIDTDKSVLTLGAALASQRKVIDHICPICEELFRGVTRAIYCSNKCRQTNKRSKKK